MAVKLSFAKLESILEKAKYTLIALYSECNTVRFAECRTPKQQKTFILFIPSKYTIQTPTTTRYEIIRIREMSDASLDRFHALLGVRGQTECDILSISSDGICHLQIDGGKAYYKYSEGDEEKEVEEEVDNEVKKEKDSVDTIKGIENNVKSLYHQLGMKKESDDTLKEDLSQNEPAVEKEDIPLNESGEDKVNDEEDDYPSDEPIEGETEIVFNDEEGGEVDEVKHAIEDEGIDDRLEEDIQDDELFSDRQYDNSRPEELLSSDVHLGIVYVVVTLPVFIRDIGVIEQTILKRYKDLDDAEGDMRKKVMLRIHSSFEQFIVSSDRKFASISKEEEELKTQLNRLTVVLAQINALNENPLYAEVDQKVYRSTIEAKSLMNNIQLELIRSKERTRELMTNIMECLDELNDLCNCN